MQIMESDDDDEVSSDKFGWLNKIQYIFTVYVVLFMGLFVFKFLCSIYKESLLPCSKPKQMERSIFCILEFSVRLGMEERTGTKLLVMAWESDL